MSIATPVSYLPGITVRWSASDLAKLDTSSVYQPVTSGAVVAFSVTNLAGTEESSGAGVANDDDWYLDVNTPTAPGMYLVLVTVTVGSVVWKGVDRFNVVPFS